MVFPPADVGIVNGEDSAAISKSGPAGTLAGAEPVIGVSRLSCCVPPTGGWAWQSQVTATGSAMAGALMLRAATTPRAQVARGMRNWWGMTASLPEGLGG